MYFKRLEIIGFKSFRDRTVLEFEQGMTVIVGPNGCGKSNVSDAIRWVLGEQSAKDLRGNRMEDVIFNGTQKDEPLGLAEVSLTLSNEKKFLPIEYGEVTITRRLFRSGESEYLINHIPVRLRDVATLVMGTGLGQTSYAHMAQGKIDEILSARPEERRYLFEEASGITKYHSQKRETLRKLEQTEANLLRVGDILMELGRQIRSLERQAEKARRYQEDFEKLKTLEEKVARKEYQAFSEKIKRLSEERHSLKEKEGTLSKEKETLSETMNRFREELETLEQELTTLQGRKMDLASKIQQDEDRLLLHKERIEELGRSRERLLKEKGALEKEIIEFRQHVEESQKEFEKSEKEIETKKGILVSLEETLKELHQLIVTSEEEIRRGKLRVIEVAKEHSEVKNDLARLAAEHHTLVSREHRLSLEREESSQEEEEMRKRLEKVEEDVRGMRGKMALCQKEKGLLEEELLSLSQSLRDLDEAIQQRRQKLTSVSSRCEILEEAKKNYEGFSQGTKAVLKEMEKKNPIFEKCHGALVDLLQVQGGYERAVEEVLGPLVQALVVENEETACQGIRYLESQRMGRVSFIPLSSLPKEGSSDGKGKGKRILEVIQAPPQYQVLLSFLFKEAYLAEEIEKIPFREGATYVTLKGDCYKRGILTGGSPLSEDVGLIGREAKIASLRKEIVSLEGMLKELQDKESKLQGIQNEKKLLLRQKEDSSHQLEVELSNQESLLSTLLAEEKKITEEISLVDLELGEVREELKDLSEKETTLTAQLHELDQEEKKIQEDLLKHQFLITEKQKEREKTVVQMAELKTALSAALTRWEEREKAHTLLQTTLQSKYDALRSKEEERRSAEERIRQLTEETARLEKEKVSLCGEKETVEGVWHEAEERQKGKLAEEGSFQNQMRLVESERDQIEKSLHDLDMKEQELQYEMKAIEERLRLTYKIELTLESPPAEEGVDPEAVRPEIERLRERLERMGPVNLVAIEEHEELKKRNEFLTVQKGDLEASKISLHEAIQKINKVTKELFMATFCQIQNYFQEYFRILFGGGEARLLLLDEKDILESGIEILASPPGKKLQSVSLLSGGERALTVIALLFAVFKEKPSPFCVLDEIDAPLDESNISRFTSVLQEFLNESQFILVTHNKRTISMADVMYGITMEKTGVSKIVSVKFKEDEVEDKRAIPA